MDIVAPINNPRQNGQMAEYGTDAGLYVEFYNEPVYMEADSAREGRPIYQDFEHVKIQPLGQNKTVVVRRVEDSDKFRFAQKYAQFKNQELQSHTGTPVSEWAVITRSQALEFKGVGIHTVEDVANLSDLNVTNFLGGHKLREKAVAFLAQAKDGSALTSLQKENEDLRASLEALQNSVRVLEEYQGQNGQPVQKRAYNKKGE